MASAPAVEVPPPPVEVPSHVRCFRAVPQTGVASYDFSRVGTVFENTKTSRAVLVTDTGLAVFAASRANLAQLITVAEPLRDEQAAAARARLDRLGLMTVLEGGVS